MANSTYKYSSFPYLDDYYSSEIGGLSPADKNRVKILFRPSRSVQVREMNSLQSQIKTQIERFGNSVYQNGTRVIDGAPRFSADIRFVDVDTTNVTGLSISQIENIKEFVVGINGAPPSASEDLLKAKILYVDDTEISNNRRRIYFTYLSSQKENNAVTKKKFVTNDVIFSGKNYEYEDDQGIIRSLARFTEMGEILREGRACVASVEKGVYYVNGYFINVEPTKLYFVPEIVVDNVNEIAENISGEVRFFVKEDIVTFVNDQQLLDNATGTPNFAAPGADRVEMELQLIFVPSDFDQYVEQKNTPLDENFKGILSREVLNSLEEQDNFETFQLLDIENSKAVRPNDVRFTGDEKREARRIFERDGNYVQKQYPLTKREAWKGLEGGKYTLPNLVARDVIETDPDQSIVENRARRKFIINLDAGVSYVNGKRNELTNVIDLFNDKARRFEDVIEEKVENFSTHADNYVIVNENYSGNLPLIGSVLDITNVSSDIIGNAEFVGIRKVGNEFRVYVNNATQNNISDATHFGGFVLDDGFVIQNPRRPDYLFNTTSSLALTQINTIDAWVTYTIADHENNTGTTFSLIENALGATEIKQFGNCFFVDSGDTIQKTDLDSNEFANGTIKAVKAMPSTTPLIVELLVRFENLNGTTAISTTKSVSLTDPGEGKTRLTVTVDGDVIGLASQHSQQYSIVDKTFINNNPNSRKGLQSRLIIRKDPTANEASLEFNVVDDDSTFFPITIHSYQQIDNRFAAERNVIDFRDGEGRLSPNRVLRVNYNAYGGRIDYVAVDDTNEYFIVQGEAAEEPVAPKIPDNALALYRLEIPPYTYNIKDDISIRPIKNRQYKASDISRIEDRVENLEYYVAINSLEQKLLDEPLEDAAGERFKNGIIADNFFNNSVADFSLQAINCSFDREAGHLLPFYNNYYVDFKFNGTNFRNPDSSVLTVNEADELIFMQQLYGTDIVNVNPYEIARFNGSIELSPPQDIWIETERLPDLITEDTSEYDALKESASSKGTLGVEWGTWSVKNWSLSNVRALRYYRGWGGYATGKLTINESRTGTETFIEPEIEETELSDSVVNIRIIPKMRSRKVYFTVRALKANTEHNVFFDGEDVTDYCFRLEQRRTFNEDNDVKSYRNLTPSQIEQQLPYSTENSLISNERGDLFGVFVIPQNSEISFSEGTHIFKITDSEENNDDLATSLARTEFSSTGRIKQKQRSILSTKTGRITTRQIDDFRSSSQTIQARRGQGNNARRNLNLLAQRIVYKDPIAQTFIQGANDQGGIFMKSVDIWFARKDSNNIPVTLEIVEVENGIPTQRTLPGSEVSIYPEDVNVDNVGQPDVDNGATTFKFKDPIYVADGAEYAIVLTSASFEYDVWYAVTGNVDPARNEVVAQNPALGVMLKSQNASTWTPVQDSNLMYRATCYQFETASSVSYTFPIRTPNDDGNVDLEALGIVQTDPYGNVTLTPYIFRNISEQVILPLTNIKWELIYDGTTINLGSNRDIRNFKQITLEDGKPLALRATLQTQDRFSSPLIDFEALAVLMPEFEINDSVDGEEEPDESDGSPNIYAEADMRYITRTIELRRPADQLNVWFDANRPDESTNIHFYIKQLDEGETVDSFHSDLEWEKIEVDSIAIASDEEQFLENRFTYKSDDPFSEFALKIVFTSPNKYIVPKLRNVRIIASS